MPEIRATYRLQLHAGFPLSAARELVPYLSRLGISHIHCSPLLQARRGSTHGYDVVDPARLDPELGTEADLEALHVELASRGMGIVLDIVPNHMAASSENPAWDDVLAHGPASGFARWFDINWRATDRELRSRVLLPILGARLSDVLKRDEIALETREGVPRVRYFEHDLPLDPSTMPGVLGDALAGCHRALYREHPACTELAEIVRTLRRLPRRSTRSAAALTRRRDSAPRILARLRELAARVPEAAAALAAAAKAFNSGGEGESRLRRLLDAQVYRLVHWRRAAREINYRRFFDVNDLVALHMEDPEVFAQTHALVLAWRRRGWLDGFRIDHPDGLLDPLGYFQRLAAAAFPEHPSPPPVYVEKILSQGESLRAEWPVAGTTGYDFLNQVEGLFIDPGGYEVLEDDYRRVIRQPLEFSAIARQGKRLVLETGLSAGVHRLTDRLLKLPAQAHSVPAVTRQELVLAIIETIVALPVYRTYVDNRSPFPGPEDLRLLKAALADARARGRSSAAALDLLEGALLAREGAVCGRFQQLSGPATAKGIEDTAFYAYAPLLSRNEVGGGPDTPLARAAAAFHAANARRAAQWPGGLLAVTTHDTKRTADVRARLDVLSEIPAEWAERVRLWRNLNLPHKRTVRGRRVPDPATVHHIFQAMVGIWPMTPLGVGDLEVLRERIDGYMVKAVREAKVRTTWTDPDESFEDGLRADVEALLAPDRSPRFLDDLERFVARIARAGLWNALSRTALHLASPGVPDLYQGDELWTFALVDPDNRRPVSFEHRGRMLEEIEREAAGDAETRARFLSELVGNPEDGRLKLHVIRAALAARKQRPAAFRSPTYIPLEAVGRSAGRVIAFGRGEGTERLLAVVPRFLAADVLSGGAPTDFALWDGTDLPLPAGWPSRWTCVLSGRSLQAEPQHGLRSADLFGILPVALLLADTDP
ncbi:MAG TPA: malto-oligosyltrehalose synthase [Gemmatimonadales bacterium]|nr:malto-oligosyltrehalose synthase [Gemmatimonadales bacterium]